MKEAGEKNTMECIQCKTRIKTITVRKYNGSWPIVISVAGTLFFFLLGGFFLGIPVLILGIYLLTAKRTLNLCPECGYFYEVYCEIEEVETSAENC